MSSSSSKIPKAWPMRARHRRCNAGDPNRPPSKGCRSVNRIGTPTPITDGVRSPPATRSLANFPVAGGQLPRELSRGVRQGSEVLAGQPPVGVGVAVDEGDSLASQHLCWVAGVVKI